jgi:hypothetical protein
VDARLDDPERLRDGAESFVDSPHQVVILLAPTTLHLIASKLYHITHGRLLLSGRASVDRFGEDGLSTNQIEPRPQPHSHSVFSGLLPQLRRMVPSLKLRQLGKAQIQVCKPTRQSNSIFCSACHLVVRPPRLARSGRH